MQNYKKTDKLTQSVLKKTKEKIYVALFGDNFVHVEKLVPGDDKKVDRILLDTIQKTRGETANAICLLLDNIELTDSVMETDTTASWMKWKHIRNSIRNKFVLKDSSKEKEGKELKN